mmetsp:Transcript_13870/g.42981  ORF Transcript_13870/g.42981 Transcript_13870/m.42981 type:complete len:845 (-) Transcript_13870:24-2558(-)
MIRALLIAGGASAFQQATNGISKVSTALHARQPIMAGNWKLNPSSVQEADGLAKGMAALLDSSTCAVSDGPMCTEVVVFPPFPFIASVVDDLENVGVGVGAQDPDGASPSWLYMILISVTLTVAAIPEGLPLTVTISLSTGCAEMVKEHVLMRKIAAVETLGSCAIICTDKTGTLTEGKMRCVKMHCAGADYEVSGKGFDPTHGSIGAKDAVAGDDLAFSPDDDRKDDPNVRGMLTSALLCCSTTLAQEEDDAGELKWTPKGNSSEAPIVVAAAKIGIWAKELEPAFPRATEIPFSSSRKMMAIVTKNENGGQPPANVPDACKLDAPFVAHVKGAPNYIIEACTTMLKDGAMVPIDAAAKAKLYEVVDELSGQALRVLAISCRPLDTLPYADDDEVEDKLTAVLDGGLQFLGLVASIDPERQGVKDAIDTASHASVRTVMITGDYLKTAQAIARNISILNPDGSQDKDAVDCNDLRPGDEYLDETDMDALTGRVNVFARAKPEDKLEIVKSLQRQGWVCAMTGDGVNDAPALKQAHIGIAVEGSTDAARNAADIVLTTEGLAPIFTAVLESRKIFQRVYSYVLYRISATIQIVLVLSLLIFIWNQTIKPLYIIILALFNDLTMITISYDNVIPSRSPEQPTINKLLRVSGVFGALMTVQSLLFMILGTYTDFLTDRFNDSDGYRQAVLYLQISLSIEGLIFATRVPEAPCYSSAPVWSLVVSVLVANVLVTVIVGLGLLGKEVAINDLVIVWAYDVVWFGIIDLLKIPLTMTMENHFPPPPSRLGQRTAESTAEFGGRAGDGLGFAYVDLGYTYLSDTATSIGNAVGACACGPRAREEDSAVVP